MCISRRALARSLGLSPVPPTEDGVKRPDGAWKGRQTTSATEEQVRASYSNGRTGNGLVCGVGGLDCQEFDDGQTYKDYLEAAWVLGLSELVDRIRAGYEEESPSGGVHWLYYCNELKGNTKLAMRLKRPDEFNEKDLKAIEKNPRHTPIKTLIETRGEGGFIIIAPSCGKVHPSGKPYVLRSGGLKSIVTITPAERGSLQALARTFNEIDDAPKPPKPLAPVVSGRDGDGVSPGDDFEARCYLAGHPRAVRMGGRPHFGQGDLLAAAREG